MSPSLLIDESLLGAVPSPADARDFQLAVDLAAPLPSKYRAPLMGPVLSQIGGTCVPHAATGMKQQQERAGGDWPVGWPPLDPYWLYAQSRQVDGIPDTFAGTTCRAALSVLLHKGEPLIGKPLTAGSFVIASYAAVPMSYEPLKAAIYQYGPLLIGSMWYGGWLRPVSAVLPPPSGAPIGGHATLLFGWDDAVDTGSLLGRNSWGKAWGVNGNYYAPARYFVPALHDAWRSLDKTGD